MRTIIAAAVALTCLTLPTGALAQRLGAVTTSSDGIGTLPVGGMPSADWRRCSNEHSIHPLARALDSCNRLLTERPDHLIKGAIYWQRAMRYRDAGDAQNFDADLQRASAAFNDAVRGDPRDDASYTARADVLMRFGRFDEALADYDHAVAIESDTSWPRLGRGDVLFRRGDYAGAAAAFDDASKIAARTAQTVARHYSARCEARAAAGVDLDRAREFCDRGVGLTDEPSYALTARAYFWFKQGDYAQAAADFERAIAEDPYNAPAVYGRGVIAVRQGRATEGETDITRARAMDDFEVSYYANAGLRP